MSRLSLTGFSENFPNFNLVFIDHSEKLIYRAVITVQLVSLIFCNHPLRIRRLYIQRMYHERKQKSKHLQVRIHKIRIRPKLEGQN